MWDRLYLWAQLCYFSLCWWSRAASWDITYLGQFIYDLCSNGILIDTWVQTTVSHSDWLCQQQQTKTRQYKAQGEDWVEKNLQNILPLLTFSVGDHGACKYSWFHCTVVCQMTLQTFKFYTDRKQSGFELGTFLLWVDTAGNHTANQLYHWYFDGWLNRTCNLPL